MPKGLALLLEPKGKSGMMEDDEEAPPSSRRMGEGEPMSADKLMEDPEVKEACRGMLEAIKNDDEEAFCRACCEHHIACDRLMGEDEEKEEY